MSTLGQFSMKGFRFERANGLNTQRGMQIAKIYLEDGRLRKGIAKLGLGTPGRLEALVSPLQVSWNGALQIFRSVPAEESQEYPDDDYLFGGSESPKIFTSSQELDDDISSDEMLRAVVKMACLVVDDYESDHPGEIDGERTRESHHSVNIAMFAEAISALQHHKSYAFRTALLDEALAPVQVATNEENQRVIDELKKERDERKIDRRTIREQKERIEELREQLEYAQLGQGHSEVTQSAHDLQKAFQKSDDKAVESRVKEAKKAAATAESRAVSLEKQLSGSQRRVKTLMKTTEDAVQKVWEEKARSGRLEDMVMEAEDELKEIKDELKAIKAERRPRKTARMRETSPSEK